MNVAQVIFDPLTLPDGVTRTYRFKRNGNWSDAVPEQTYNWFNKAIASSVANDWQIYIYYTHFGKNNGLTPTSIDSIRAVHQIKDSLGIWIPNPKDILNQQAASAFAQVRVENINGKRTLNITSLKDWSWGSHVPDPDDSLRLELVSGPSCLFLTTMIKPNLLTGFACFLTSGTDSVYTFIFELKDKCGAVDRDTVHIRVRPPANLVAGDPNGDLFVTISDVVYIINYLFKNGPPPVHCPKSGDVNCDGKVTISDAIYLINYLFKGGSAPCR